MARGATPAVIEVIPNIRIANPIKIRPIFFLFFFFDFKIKQIPINANRGEKVSGLRSFKMNAPPASFNDARLKSHAVIVVPSFAPITILTV